MPDNFLINSSCMDWPAFSIWLPKVFAHITLTFLGNPKDTKFWNDGLPTILIGCISSITNVKYAYQEFVEMQ